MPEQVVVFRIGSAVYGVNLESVGEVIQGNGIRAVADSPGPVDGVITLRGVNVPVIDFRKTIGIFSRENLSERWLVIVTVSDRRVGLLVDAVLDVVQLASEAVEPFRSSLHTCHTRFLRGFGRLEGKKLPLVCADKLVSQVPAYDYAGVTAS